MHVRIAACILHWFLRFVALSSSLNHNVFTLDVQLMITYTVSVNSSTMITAVCVVTYCTGL